MNNYIQQQLLFINIHEKHWVFSLNAFAYIMFYTKGILLHSNLLLLNTTQHSVIKLEVQAQGVCCHTRM